MTPNQSAFLSMIAHAEGTDRAVEPYRVTFGFAHVIESFKDHPYATGEWEGFRYGPLQLLSTAAGRYQINIASWRDGKARLSLTDFTPTSQDDWALDKLKQLGALALINDGDLTGAIGACSRTWASFPGSTAGQPTKTLAALTEVYTELGGELA